jgi:hypothetical protein
VYTPTVLLTPTANAVYTVTGANGSCISKKTTNVVYSKCTGIDEISPSGISVYPNPNSGAFTISVTKTSRILLMNEIGQLVRSLECRKEEENKVLVTGLAPGIYFIAIDGEKGTIKIIVTN